MAAAANKEDGCDSPVRVESIPDTRGGKWRRRVLQAAAAAVVVRTTNRKSTRYYCHKAASHQYY